jgi:hypothetical protein
MRKKFRPARRQRRRVLGAPLESSSGVFRGRRAAVLHARRSARARMTRRAIVACASLFILLVPVSAGAMADWRWEWDSRPSALPGASRGDRTSAAQPPPSAESATTTPETFPDRTSRSVPNHRTPSPTSSTTPRRVPLSLADCTGYVSPSGADANRGTSSAPFRTISHAEAAARPGDVVCVRGGTYHEQVQLRRSGAKASRITVSGAPNETAIIDGTDVPVGPTDALFGIDGGTNYVTVQDLTIRNSSGRGIVNGGSHNRVLNSTITHTRNAGLLTTNWSAAASHNEYVGNDISYTVAGNDCHVPSDPCNVTGGWESAVNVYEEGPGAAGHNLYENNRIHDNDGEGMTLMDYDVVRSNTVYDNFGVEIYLDRKQHDVVEGNLLYESETSYLPIGQNQSYRLLARGIVFADEFAPVRTSHNIIRNNMMINLRAGIHFWNAISGSGLIDNLIENNTIVNSWDFGISFDPSSSTAGTVLRNNLVVPRLGSITRGVTGVRGIDVTANLFVLPGDSGDPHLRGEGTFSFDPNTYKLRPGASSAVDKGVATSATKDFFGRPRRHGSGYDIGADELG